MFGSRGIWKLLRSVSSKNKKGVSINVTFNRLDVKKYAIVTQIFAKNEVVKKYAILFHEK